MDRKDVVLEAPPPPQKRMELQSIENFEAEMAIFDAAKVMTATTQPIPQHLPKKPKRTIDAGALEAERKAREEMGNENWIGKLLEYRQAHPARLISGALPRNQGIEYKEVPINSSIIRFAFAVEFAESPQQFGGANLSFSNKKDAKQWAAKKALDWLIGNNCMASTGKRTIDAEALEAKKAAREEIGNNNWVGKLLEYRNAHPVTAPSRVAPSGARPGLDYKEENLNSGIIRFAYTIEIEESTQTFGGADLPFSNKQDAKQYAAKKAIDWLIANNHMPSDGSARFSKPPPPMHLP
ncbi:hypothetical protein F5882DRAFT_167609 [Hyaloscypha sp. PMI_1271]|nr:hypothetical protein F5882DRAFT_167609 [Hyaloscypha sp. PMI_1271]